MKAATATSVALLALCLVHSGHARLSVFRQEVIGVPGMEGHTYVVVNEDAENGPQPIAQLHTLHSTGSSPSSVFGSLTLPFDWLAKQMEMVQNMQNQLVLESLPDMPTPPPMGMDDGASLEDLLKRVKCQRMRDALMQGIIAQQRSVDQANAEMPMMGRTSEDDDSENEFSPDELASGSKCVDGNGSPIPCSKAVATSTDEADMPMYKVTRAGQKLEDFEQDLRDGMDDDDEADDEELTIEDDGAVEGSDFVVRRNSQILSGATWTERDDQEQEEAENEAQEQIGMPWSEIMTQTKEQERPSWMPMWRQPERDPEMMVFEAVHRPPPGFAWSLFFATMGSVVVCGVVVLSIVAAVWLARNRRREQAELEEPLLIKAVQAKVVSAADHVEPGAKGIDTSIALLKGQQ